MLSALPLQPTPSWAPQSRPGLRLRPVPRFGIGRPCLGSLTRPIPGFPQTLHSRLHVHQWSDSGQLGHGTHQNQVHTWPAADQVEQQPAASAQAPPPQRRVSDGRPLTLFFPVPPKAIPVAVLPKHSAASAPPTPAAGYPQPVPKPGSSRRTHARRRR